MPQITGIELKSHPLPDDGLNPTECAHNGADLFLIPEEGQRPGGDVSDHLEAAEKASS